MNVDHVELGRARRRSEFWPLFLGAMLGAFLFAGALVFAAAIAGV